MEKKPEWLKVRYNQEAVTEVAELMRDLKLNTVCKEANCPNLAIYAEGKHAVIDPEICEDCKVCQYMCARGVIKEQEVPEYIFLQREALGIREGE